MSENTSQDKIRRSYAILLLLFIGAVGVSSFLAGSLNYTNRDFDPVSFGFILFSVAVVPLFLALIISFWHRWKMAVITLGGILIGVVPVFSKFNFGNSYLYERPGFIYFVFSTVVTWGLFIGWCVYWIKRYPEPMTPHRKSKLSTMAAKVILVGIFVSSAFAFFGWLFRFSLEGSLGLVLGFSLFLFPVFLVGWFVISLFRRDRPGSLWATGQISVLMFCIQLIRVFEQSDSVELLTSLLIPGLSVLGILLAVKFLKRENRLAKLQ